MKVSDIDFINATKKYQNNIENLFEVYREFTVCKYLIGEEKEYGSDQQKRKK